MKSYPTNPSSRAKLTTGHRKLGEVCEIIGGGTPSTSVSEYWSGDIVWITPKDMGKLNDFEIFDSNKKITEEGLKKSSAKLLPKGSVVLSSRAPIGYVAIAGVPLATNQGCRSFICEESKLYNRYLFHFLITQTELLNKLGGGSTFKEISGSKLKDLEIPLPPLSEQKKIVAKLERVLTKISEAKKLRIVARENANNLLPAELHKIFENEKKSGLVKVGNVCDIKGGKRLPRGHKLQIEKSNHPYIRVADFIPYGIDKSRIKFIDEETYSQIKRYTISKDDVFISIAGTIGATGIIPEDLNGANLTENAAKLTNLRKIEQKYLMYMLTSDHVQNQIRGDLIQTTISKFGLFRIAKLKIPLPPLAEQKRIVKHLDSLSQKLQKLQEYQKNTQSDLLTFEQAILHKVFSLSPAP